MKKADVNLLLELTQNILSLSAIAISNDSKELSWFEKEFCFDKDLQPMFTTDALHYLLNSAVPKTFYEVVDYFGVSIVFFEYANQKFIVGPYVKSSLSESQIETVLIEHNAAASKALALKLYYTKLPILYASQIQKTIEGILKTISINEVEFEYRRLTGFIKTVTKNNQQTFGDIPNYSEIYKRYDSEKRFLLMIKNGDVENISTAFKEMSSNFNPHSYNSDIQNYYASASSFAIIRSLARKAAEQSGLSVITIDSITQKYVQLASTGSVDSQQQFILEMILELTKAVRNHRISYGQYSSTIQKVIEYIDLNLSEELTLDAISKHVGISISHLSMLFKKETGETISFFIAKQRCKKAASLLKETELPIQEISSFVGYDDNNYFVKVFKKIYNMTPSIYRKG